MQPKRPSNGKLKKVFSLDTDFETVTYTSNKLNTTTALLAVEDETVVIKVRLRFTNYFWKKKKQRYQLSIFILQNYISLAVKQNFDRKGLTRVHR